jgi:hypothetical protein
LNDIVSMVTNATSTKTSNVEVLMILDDIRNGKWRTQVEEIRTEYRRAVAKGLDGKKAVDHLKKQLPAALFSGRFSRRANAALKEHSGLICADLDDLDGDLERVRASLTESPHAVAMFLSPTGSGLKVLCRVADQAESHRACFQAVEQHVRDLTGRNIDVTCKDVARLCFVSYDPDLWIRPDEAKVLCSTQNADESTVKLDDCGSGGLGTCGTRDLQ